MNHVERASEIMLSFAQRTGLSGERAKQRYLWTDAFAVCNFLGLARATSEQRYVDLALALVDQVHHVLGHHRADDARHGWISGLREQEGEAHPTRGGLRIGKPLPERQANEPFDERLEWDRDGQYFHYLTRWMHALDRVARATHQPRWNLYARELAYAAHAAFTYQPRGHAGRRMYWKLSVDLSRPLVRSMGLHDPLDGLVTCAELQTTASMLSGQTDGPSLDAAAADFAAMTHRQSLVTQDPLGIGGLLVAAQSIAHMQSHPAFVNGELFDEVLTAAGAGLSEYVARQELEQSASQRLAFRELGLAIGLRAIASLERALIATQRRMVGWSTLRARLSALEPYFALATTIESFWLDPEHRRAGTWLEHRDINDVMLATSLVPEGYSPPQW